MSILQMYVRLEGLLPLELAELPTTGGVAVTIGGTPAMANPVSSGEVGNAEVRVVHCVFSVGHGNWLFAIVRAGDSTWTVHKPCLYYTRPDERADALATLLSLVSHEPAGETLPSSP